jgi:S-disulfanyl-L-cysteine oxidoreductase SoxD
MSMPRRAALLLALPLTACNAQSAPAIGQAITERDVAAWNIDVSPGNGGLPPGHGNVAEGRRIYAENCAACHGEKGDDGPAPKLRGGRGSLASAKPLATVGSYWPYAETLFDYVRRAMPFDRPGSLSDGQVYAVTAYLLRINDIVAEDTDLDAARLAQIRMPNRGGFVPDPRDSNHL